MSDLRVLGVGAGYFSQFQYLGWRNIAGVECVGIVNRDADKARALADRYGIHDVYTDLPAALDATRPDLVDIITPPETHRAFVAQCVERRIPAICQKPFGRDYADAVAITEHAERAGVPLVIHENFRWEPWYREAKRLIDAGTLGALHGVAFRLRPGDGQGPRAYLDRQPYFQQMPLFLVKETAIHWIDTFRFLMGDVTAVYARLRRINPVIAGEDAGYIVFEFAGGATGLFDGNRLNDHVAQNPRRTMGEAWLEGERGVLRLDGDARLWWKPHHGRRDRARVRPRPRRHVRRRRLRVAAAPRRRALPRRRAAREHGARLPGQPARAGGRLPLGGDASPHRACHVRPAAAGRPRRRHSVRLTATKEDAPCNADCSSGNSRWRRSSPARSAPPHPHSRRRRSSSATPTSPAARARRRPSCSRRRSSSTRRAATRSRCSRRASSPTIPRAWSSCSWAASTSR